MSTPKNHHHVSQCQIRAFFNETEKKIYCYDKPLDNFYFKTTSKSLFSEDFANTREHNNELDHHTRENELNEYFEKDFDKHSQNIQRFVDNPSAKYDSKLWESLYNIGCYGLIADVRFPENKKSVDDAHNKLMIQIARKIRLMGDEKQAERIEELIVKKTKYSNIVSYQKMAIRRLDKMGPLSFRIYSIKTDDVFLLPDIGCVHTRVRINEYINPKIIDIASVGIPLTPKVFMFASSKKLGNTSSSLSIADSNDIRDINWMLFHSAFKTVATSDESQLKKVVSCFTDKSG